jgi:anti-sigma B factor antagonist
VTEGTGDERRAGSLTVSVKRFSTGDVVVKVAGELLAALSMHRAIDDELKRSPARLAVDLTRVTRVDTDGIMALALAATTAGESDISFCLVGVQGGPVEDAIAEADLTELFDVFPSLTHAWGVRTDRSDRPCRRAPPPGRPARFL